jgi:amidase
MGVQGPMARNVADLALLLSVQAGFDARAPLSIDGDGSEFRPPIRGSVKGKRIAWAGDFGGFTPNEPGVLETCRGALKTFEAAGCVVEDAFPAFDFEKLWASFIRPARLDAGRQPAGALQRPRSGGRCSSRGGVRGGDRA